MSNTITAVKLSKDEKRSYMTPESDDVIKDLNKAWNVLFDITEDLRDGDKGPYKQVRRVIVDGDVLSREEFADALHRISRSITALKIAMEITSE